MIETCCCGVVPHQLKIFPEFRETGFVYVIECQVCGRRVEHPDFRGALLAWNRDQANAKGGAFPEWA